MIVHAHRAPLDACSLDLALAQLYKLVHRYSNALCNHELWPRPSYRAPENDPDLLERGGLSILDFQ